MSALSTPLSSRVVYKQSALDHDGITRWDGRNHQTARTNWQKPYPSAQEVWESKSCRVDKILTSLRSSTDVPTAFGFQGKKDMTSS